jgi:hypothetical protein
MAGARFAKMSTTKLRINARAPMTGLEQSHRKPLHPLSVSSSHQMCPQRLDTIRKRHHQSRPNP